MEDNKLRTFFSCLSCALFTSYHVVSCVCLPSLFSFVTPAHWDTIAHSIAHDSGQTKAACHEQYHLLRTRNIFFFFVCTKLYRNRVETVHKRRELSREKIIKSKLQVKIVTQNRYRLLVSRFCSSRGCCVVKARIDQIYHHLLHCDVHACAGWYCCSVFFFIIQAEIIIVTGS